MTSRLRLSFALACSLWIFSLTSGCDAEEFSIQILGVKQFDIVNCIPFEASDALLSQGTVDLILAEDYVLNLSMKNLLLNSLTVNNFKPKDGYLNTTDVNLTQAVVRYRDPDEVGFGFGEEERTIPMGGLLFSEANEAVTQGLKVITPQMMDILRENGAFKGINASGRVGLVANQISMILSIRVQGKTLDGNRVESNEISFPLDICMGCRVLKQGRDQMCSALNESEQDLVSSCPHAIGRDQNFTSCSICRQIAVEDSFATLCTQ